MITNQAEELIKLSERKKLLQNSATNLEGFETRQKQIQDAISVISPLVKTLNIFRKKGITVNLVPDINNFLDFLKIAAKQVVENPEWILPSNDSNGKNFDGKKFDGKVNSLSQSIKNSLLKAWKQYQEEPMLIINDEILNLLDIVSSFQEKVKEIRQLKKDITTHNKTLPESDEDFERMQKWMTTLKECWNSLSSDDVSDSVIDFLKAAANQGAPLNLLTPEVQEWLKKHDITNVFKICLS